MIKASSAIKVQEGEINPCSKLEVLISNQQEM
jgi:hypothetical protein